MRMDKAEIIQGIEQNRALKKEMLEKHRPAFHGIWLPLAQVMEEAVVKPRILDSAFARALDLFFIETFKSHQSLYLLAVAGHEEDAATIDRRLLEIALQVAYLCSDPAKREERGEQYLAHFWHNAQSILASVDLPQERREWWEDQYNHHKKWLQFDNKGTLFVNLTRIQLIFFKNLWLFLGVSGPIFLAHQPTNALTLQERHHVLKFVVDGSW